MQSIRRVLLATSRSGVDGRAVRREVEPLGLGFGLEDQWLMTPDQIRVMAIPSSCRRSGARHGARRCIALSIDSIRQQFLKGFSDGRAGKGARPASR